MLTKSDLSLVLDALESADSELDALTQVQEWYVTAVTDKLKSAMQIVRSELTTEKERK